MKRIFTAVALVLVSGSLLLTSGQALPGMQPSSGLSLSISENGTLLNVLDADGKSLGPLTLDGFLVSYHKLGASAKTARAGATYVQGLHPGQINVGENSASVTVMTYDHALEITNEFTLDKQRKKLTIRRSFRNLSGKKLRIQMTEYLDPKLIGPPGSAPLRMRAVQRVAANGCDEEQLAERPAGYPCITVICPSVHQASLTTPGNRVSLRWNCTKAVDPGKTVHFAVWVNL